MDEIQKTEMRNYAMSAGFFIIAFQALLFAMMPVSGIEPAAFTVIADACLKIIALLLILTGVILIVLKNRDLSAIIFLLIGMFFATKAYTTVIGSEFIINIFLLILALIILTAKDRKKYLLFIMPALIGVIGLITIFTPALLLDLILGVVALYFAFACASERINLPGGALLKADVVTDFKAGGSVLGYLLFGISTAVWAFVYLGNISFESALVIDSLCGAMLIFTGVLLWAVGKMRFTPVMFILMGFLQIIGVMVSGPLYAVIGAMFIVLGLFAVLRTESRILPALMLIIYGCTYFITPLIIGVGANLIVSGVLNLIVALITVYMAFAVFMQKKLPLF